MVRVKQRYILGELIFDNESIDNNVKLVNIMGQKELQDHFKQEVSDLYGDLGHAKIAGNFMMKFWNVETKVFILRVGRENEQMVTSALALMNQLKNLPCRVRILHVSGTLLKIENNLKLKSECFLSNMQK